MRNIVIGLLSLLVVAVLASVLTAQVTRTEPQVLSGSDIGFRIEGTGRSGEPVGTLVIRVNGQWIVPGSSVVRKPAVK